MKSVDWPDSNASRDPDWFTSGVGAGPSLAIARRIVELHGGTLTARNHAQGGAVFTIELPL